MVVTDALEGVVDGVLWFHYDISNDVLYLRMVAHRDAETVSEETRDGLLVLRRTDNNESVGMTVVNWWKRFGNGDLPDSISELQRQIEPWAKKVAA
jgi:hypothetical protein